MRGAILFNGNAETVDDLVRAAAPLLRSSRHEDPEVASSRRVLLVTAAWAEREHDEAHVKRSLNAIGLPSRFEHGFDRSLVNLSLIHELGVLARRAPRLIAAWHEQRRVAEMARSFYLEHNAHLIQLFRKTLAVGKRADPKLTVARLAEDQGHYGVGETGERLLRYTLSRELRQALDTLEANDDHLVDLLTEIEGRAFDAAGLAYDDAWRAGQARPVRPWPPRSRTPPYKNCIPPTRSSTATPPLRRRFLNRNFARSAACSCGLISLAAHTTMR